MLELRIVVWNANCGVHRKLEALLALRPSVAIIPECAPEETLRSKSSALLDDVSMVWVGDNAVKGLAVFGFGPWKVEIDQTYDHRLEWIAPVHVDGPQPFNLLAVWAKNHRAKTFHPLEPRKRQPVQAATVYRSFIGERETVIAGDFNGNVRWDTPRGSANFAVTIDVYAQLGLRSAYHSHHHCDFGEEPDPTLYWRTRTIDGLRYHIDYCFVPSLWLAHLRSVDIGSFSDWVGSGLSDHTPLIVDISKTLHGDPSC